MLWSFREADFRFSTTEWPTELFSRNITVNAILVPSDLLQLASISWEGLGPSLELRFFDCHQTDTLTQDLVMMFSKLTPRTKATKAKTSKWDNIK